MSSSRWTDQFIFFSFIDHISIVFSLLYATACTLGQPPRSSAQEWRLHGGFSDAPRPRPLPARRGLPHHAQG